MAGLLKAMGYCARVMPKEPDGGRDVVASADALGLESPRIVAEVKHRKGAMGGSRSSVVHRRSEGGRPQAIRLHGRLHQGGTLRG